MSEPASTSGWVSDEAIILDETGLHARPAVRLTKLAKRFAAQVEIRSTEAGDWVNAKSPNAVMKLRAGHKTVLAIRAQGEDAAAAVAAICALVKANFDESATS